MNNQEKQVASNEAGGVGARGQEVPFDGLPTHRPNSPSDTEKLFSPVRFLIITIGGIFLAEIAAMIVITPFQNLPYAVQTLIDATVMVILIFPLVYSFSLKPLIEHIEERRRAEYALRRSEERFIKAFHSSPAALALTRLKDGIFLDVNKSFLRLSEYEREEVIGNTTLGLNMYVDPQARARLSEETVGRQLRAEEGVRDFEIEARLKSGEIRTVLLSTEAIELDAEACILTSISDITERKQSEARLRRLNRALSVLKEGNELLIRATDENELLEEMCKILVDVGEYRMAWVGYAGHDEGKRVRAVAYAGFENGYLERAHISWADNEHGRGPTGAAVREGLTQVNHNFLTDPKVAPWRESALARGYHSSIAMPLKDGDQTYGALTIYSSAPDAFDNEEVNLLTELAHDLMFGIQSLRIRAERNKAQEQAREMALFPTLNPDAVLQVQASGRIKMTNPAATKLGITAGVQLVDVIPDLAELDLEHCITHGTTQHIADTRLGDLVLLWTVRGAPELGLALFYSTDMTEYKQAEKRIHQLSRIVEQTEDTVVVTDCDGWIEYVNPAFEHLTGYTKEEALGKKPNVIKSGLHDADFYRNMWSAILGGEVFQAEIANCKKNGEIFYEVKTITPLRDAQGRITHFVATGKDITEHKRDEEQLRKAYDELEIRVQERTMELRIANAELADEIHIRMMTEDALRQSEDRLKRAQEIAHLGSWELDLIKNELTWSDEVYRIFGLQPQQFGATYEAFLEAVHPEDRATVDTTYSGSIREGRDQYEIEHRIVKHSSRDVRIVHEKCEHFRNESGQIIRSVGMVHDITERKQAEDTLQKVNTELQQRVAELQTLMDVAPVGIAIGHDPEGRVITVNKLLSEWLNAPEGANVSLNTPEEHRQVTYQVLRKGEPLRAEDLPIQAAAQKARGVRNDEFSIVRSDGRVIEMLANAEPLFDMQGHVRGSIAAYNDITERKRAEEALRAARDELELRVQERTRELAVANRDLLKEVAERKEVERQLRIQTTAMEAAANGIVITDRGGTIQWTNPALSQISGYDRPELIGRNMRVFSSRQHGQEHYQDMWETILSGKVWRGEITNRRKDGNLYVEEQTITPVRDENDQIRHFISIKQDITQQKRVEEALELERRRLRKIMDTMPDGVFIINPAFGVEYVNPVIEKDFGAIDGRKCYDYFHDRTDPCPWCKNPEVLAGNTVLWEHHYVKTDRTYDVFETPFVNSDDSVSKFKMLHDITERKHTEQELAERNIQLQGLSIAEREQRQLSEALFEAALVLNRSMKLEEVLPLILEQIKEVIPYQLANITLLEGDSFYDASHAGDERWSAALGEMPNRFPLDRYPIMMEMRETGQPSLIPDTQLEPNWITVPGLGWCRSYLATPLLVESKVIGFVTLFAQQAGFFSQEMCDRLQAFAAHAAVAIQNAWLFEQVRSSNERLQSLSHRLVEIQESERLYIARELHDEAGQMLTSLMLDLRMLEINAWQSDVILKKVAEMEVSLNDVQESLHRIAMSLRPATLDHLGLVAALRQHAESVGEKYGLEVSFRAGKFSKRLPPDMETELYRIVQEALTNVVRHSHARHVDIVLTMRDDDLVVIVEDDGIGFDPETALSKDRMGLFSMRERAEMIGGKLVIESAPDKGTTLMVEVKYADTNSDHG
ncbi:MAG: PAS domain S-box protein [Chloroflexota bacterium]